MIRDRLRLNRNAGITTLRAGLAGDDLDTQLSHLAHLLDLVDNVNAEVSALDPTIEHPRRAETLSGMKEVARLMDLATGTYAIGPATGALTLHTGRTGFGARAGHDLVIEVTRWSGTVRFDAERIEASTVEVVVDATSLEVREGKGGAVPLLPINKSEIAKTINKVLSTKKHPEIRFGSSAVAPTRDGFIVHGNLTIAGGTRPAELSISIDLITGPPRGTVTTTVMQSDFGIKTYSAMLGALKVRDAVEVRARVQLP